MRIRTHNKEKKQENMETEHIKKTQMIPLMYMMFNTRNQSINWKLEVHDQIIFCSI